MDKKIDKKIHNSKIEEHKLNLEQVIKNKEIIEEEIKNIMLLIIKMRTKINKIKASKNINKDNIKELIEEENKISEKIKQIEEKFCFIINRVS